MAYIDPWGNFIQGTQSLQNVLANMDSSAQQKKLRDLQIEEAQIKLAAAKQGAEDKQALRDLEQTLASERKDVTTPGYGGLADVQAYEQASQANRDKAALPVMWSDTATAPIPAGGRGINIPTLSGQPAPPATPLVMGRGLGAATPSVYEQFSKNVAERPYTQDQLDALNEKAIAAQQASGLSSYAPTTTQVPLTSLEKAQRRADLLAGQGAYKEAGEALTAGIDISSKIPAAAVDQQHKLLAFAQPRLALGASPDQVKEQTIAFAKQMGMSADQIAALQNMTLSPNGMMIATLPDGSKVTATLQADGTVKTEYHKKEADSSMTGGLDVLAAKNRAMALMKQNPRLTQAEAMAQAADQIRAENNQAKQSNIQLRINAGAGQKSVAGETGLRKEFNALQEVKNYKTFSGQYATMAATMGKIKDFKSLNPADQVLIMDFNKALDPSSVVRESEYARTPENMSILNRASAATSRLMQGGVLNQTERQALMQAAKVMKQSYKAQYDAARAQYQRIAEENGYSPRNVVPTLEQTGDAPTGGRTVTRTGRTSDGRKVIEYSDGTRVIQ